MKPSTRLFKPESLLNVFQYLPFSFHSVWSFAMGQSITISLRIVTIVYLQKPSGLGLSEKWAYRVGTEIDFLILQICYFVWKVLISLPEYHSIPSCFSRRPSSLRRSEDRKKCWSQQAHHKEGNHRQFDIYVFKIMTENWNNWYHLTIYNDWFYHKHAEYFFPWSITIKNVCTSFHLPKLEFIIPPTYPPPAFW